MSIQKYINLFLLTSIFVGLTKGHAMGQSRFDSLYHKYNWAIESIASGGKIIVHTKNFRPDAKHPIYTYELNFYHQLNGKKEWQYGAKLPRVGGSFMYANYSSPQVLGQSFSALAFIQFRMFHTRRVLGFFSLADGLAYLDKAYNVVHDSTNNVIGSHWNETTQFRVRCTAQVSTKLTLTAHTTLQHWSNALYSKPNLGINTISLGLGLQYTLSGPLPFAKPIDLPKINTRWHLMAQTGYARNERVQPGGPKYPLYLIDIGAWQQLTAIRSIQLCGEYQFDKGMYEMIKISELVDKGKVLHSSSVSIQMGYGYTFGSWKMMGKMGIYVHQDLSPNFISYQRLALEYLFNKNYSQSHVQPYLGAEVHSHLGAAEYFDIYVGTRWK